MAKRLPTSAGSKGDKTSLPSYSETFSKPAASFLFSHDQPFSNPAFPASFPTAVLDWKRLARDVTEAGAAADI
jgi:hypothetical protein